MKGVVLSAGRGSRLSPITSYLPKPLLPVGGRRLIDLVLEFLSIKCDEIVLIAGYMSDTLLGYVRRRYPSVKVLSIDRLYPGNLYTLLAGEKHLRNSDLIIANADHVFEQSLWQMFPSEEGLLQLACHRKGSREFLEDEMKVKVEGDKLLKMSKTLACYDGAYTGIALIKANASPLFWNTAHEVFARKGEVAKVEDVFNELAHEGIPRVVWIDDVPFWEVDTVEDLRRLWNAHKVGAI